MQAPDGFSAERTAFLIVQEGLCLQTVANATFVLPQTPCMQSPQVHINDTRFPRMLHFVRAFESMQKMIHGAQTFRPVHPHQEEALPAKMHIVKCFARWISCHDESPNTPDPVTQ